MSPRSEDTETEMLKVLNDAQQAIDIVYSMEALISEKLVRRSILHFKVALFQQGSIHFTANYLASPEI